MKRLNISLLFLSTSFLGFAQTATPGATAGERPIAPFPSFLDHPLFYFWIAFAAVIVFVIYVLVHSINVLSKKLQKVEEVETAAIIKVRKKTAWDKLMDMLTRSVPVEQEKDVLLDHDYDGIKELDNKLPPWWVWGFYITIVFAFVYIFYYHMSGIGKLSAAEYKEEMSKAAVEKEERMKLNTNNITEENVVRLTDEASIKEGSEIFMKNCVACHGDKGQGGVGPNLTDQYWLHGGSISNIFHTVTEGYPSKGMISWKAQLSPNQIQRVVSFIMTLQGSNPPGAKEPQGELYNPAEGATQTTGVGADSLKTDSLKTPAI